MNSIHHITFQTPPAPPSSLWSDEEEVEGETILLGREKHNERMNQIAMKRNAEERHHLKNAILRSQYKTYLEALDKYDKKEEERLDIHYNKESGTEEEEDEIYRKFKKNKKARDKKFKDKWTKILKPYYAHL